MTWQCVKTNSTPVVHIKIAGKWMFIPLKMVLIGIDWSMPWWVNTCYGINGYAIDDASVHYNKNTPFSVTPYSYQSTKTCFLGSTMVEQTDVCNTYAGLDMCSIFKKRPGGHHKIMISCWWIPSELTSSACFPTIGHVHAWVYSLCLLTKNLKHALITWIQQTVWLVVSTPLKNIFQLGWLFPIYGKIKTIKTCAKPPTSCYLQIYRV